MAQVDRRGAVRVPARLAMEIKIGAGDIARVETMNVSANGVYFVSDKHIPLLTKLRVTLVLPEGGESSRSHDVSCEGVVVRVEPEEPTPSGEEYSVACYFTSILDQDQEHLETYILRQVAF